MTTVIPPEHLIKLPIFPLPHAVLFPQTIIPLHIFEARYCKMISDIVDKDVPFAIVRPLNSNSESLMPPEVCRTAGLGRVHELVKLPAGRYFLLAEGLARVRIVEELESPEPYRLVRAELIQDIYPKDAVLSKVRETLQATILSLGQCHPRAAAALAGVFQATDDSAAISDLIASLFVKDPEERQRLLETSLVELRLESVTMVLAEMLGPSASDSSDDTAQN